MNARTFDLGDVLTATTGCLVAERGIEAMYDLLNFMTGDNLLTHQLPRAFYECKPHILAKHPDLADVKIPAGGFPDDKAAVFAWVAEQVERYGATRDLTPLADEDHTYIDPLTELLMIAPDKPVIVINVDGDAS